jgi:hypothetical protein
VARGHEISASAGISKSGAKIQTTKFGHLWLCDSDRFNFRRLLEALSILADMENSMNNSPTLAP